MLGLSCRVVQPSYEPPGRADSTLTISRPCGSRFASGGQRHAKSATALTDRTIVVTLFLLKFADMTRHWLRLSPSWFCFSHHTKGRRCQQRPRGGTDPAQPNPTRPNPKFGQQRKANSLKGLCMQSTRGLPGISELNPSRMTFVVDNSTSTE